MRSFGRAGLALVACAACLGACSHANYNPPLAGATATPSSTASGTPSATATPTSAPAVCGTAAPGAVYIAMGSYIEPGTPDPTYGSVYGYAIVDTSGNYSLQATPLQLRPSDTIQFTNVDPPTASDANGTSHSAVGLQTAGFPEPHTFPSPAFSPSGSTFSNSVLWSTGEIPSEAAGLCYSQTFVVPASGAYYFGDLDFYNSVNMRDVIVVSSSAAQ